MRGYDVFGTAKTITDLNGVVTIRETDARGRTTSTTSKAVTGDANEPVCVQKAVTRYSQSPPKYCLATNNCQNFVAYVLDACGLTTKTPFEQLEGMK